MFHHHSPALFKDQDVEIITYREARIAIHDKQIFSSWLLASEYDSVNMLIKKIDRSFPFSEFEIYAPQRSELFFSLCHILFKQCHLMFNNYLFDEPKKQSDQLLSLLNVLSNIPIDITKYKREEFAPACHHILQKIQEINILHIKKSESWIIAIDMFVRPIELIEKHNLDFSIDFKYFQMLCHHHLNQNKDCLHDIINFINNSSIPIQKKELLVKSIEAVNEVILEKNSLLVASSKPDTKSDLLPLWHTYCLKYISYVKSGDIGLFYRFYRNNFYTAKINAIKSAKSLSQLIEAVTSFLTIGTANKDVHAFFIAILNSMKANETPNETHDVLATKAFKLRMEFNDALKEITVEFNTLRGEINNLYGVLWARENGVKMRLKNEYTDKGLHIESKLNEFHRIIENWMTKECAIESGKLTDPQILDEMVKLHKSVLELSNSEIFNELRLAKQKFRDQEQISSAPKVTKNKSSLFAILDLPMQKHPSQIKPPGLF